MTRQHGLLTVALLVSVAACGSNDTDLAPDSGLGRRPDASVPVEKRDSSPLSDFSCGSQALHTKTHATCAKMDVTGQGICNCISMGWMWNGTACTKLEDGFCSCVGNDCNKLTKSKDECLSQHASCTASGA